MKILVKGLSDLSSIGKKCMVSITQLVRCRSYDKYETESQVVGLVLMKKGFESSSKVIMNSYSSNLLNFQ